MNMLGSDVSVSRAAEKLVPAMTAEPMRTAAVA